METRRSFLRFATAGFGALAAGAAFPSIAADAPLLVDRVVAACRRLAPLGWRAVLLAGHLIAAVLDGKAPAREAAHAYHDWIAGWFRTDAARLSTFYRDLGMVGFA